MDAVTVTVVCGLLLLAGAVGTGRRLVRYPGGWACSFGGAFSSRRRELAEARSAVRALERQRRRELHSADRELRRVEAERNRRIRALHRQRKQLDAVGHGELLHSLGGLTLHQHAVLVRGRAVPLHRARIGHDLARHQHVLLVTGQDGRRRRLTLDRDRYSDDAVRTLVARAQGALVDEETFQQKREADIAETEAQLKQALADLAPVQQARERQAKAVERWRNDPRPVRAEARLKAVGERWCADTGRRPG